jgi:hypothetical protein
MGVFLSGCQRPDELMRAAVNGTGQVAAGNSFPRGVAVPSVFGVLADTAVYNEKIRALPCSREHYAGAAAGVRSNIFYITTLSRFP